MRADGPAKPLKSLAPTCPPSSQQGDLGAAPICLREGPSKLTVQLGQRGSDGAQVLGEPFPSQIQHAAVIRSRSACEFKGSRRKVIKYEAVKATL